ncbi:AI-2E family transporter [Aeoliella sp. ICT_H6.2]|uniref:AI-2E family transporter n=1 Tax=Aeoliella straminimaris TaxID=2954799 RepID=A0A9X2FHN2_9BACT|nr:AI-2E family transporter [Aeoliella straminimaris]MCO6045106.1 AI-2E family transporter [Aeoliella straminimaris]
MDITQLQRDSQIRTTALVILTFIAVAVALYFLRPVLMPFVLALFIASGISPVLNMVQKRLGSTRPFAIFLTFAVSLGLTIVICVVIAQSINQLRDAQRPFREGFTLMLVRIESLADPFLPEPSEREDSTPKPDEAAGPAGQAPAENATNKTAPEVEPPADTLGDRATGTVAPPPTSEQEFDQDAAALEQQQATPTSSSAGMPASDESNEKNHRLIPFIVSRMNSVILVGVNELLAVLSSGLLVMIFLFFMLLGGSQVQLPENNIWRDVDAHVRKYIVAKTGISLVTGFVFGAVLWMFGVPLAFVLGMLAFLLNFIPNLGPIIASILPVPLVWVLVEATWAGEEGAHMGLVKAIVVITLAAVVQFLSGNVFEPKIMGNQFHLHPIAILLSLMFWYMIWGMVGAFLAVPITSASKIIFAELDSTRLAADLLEGNLSILAKRNQSTDAPPPGPVQA